MYFLLFYDYVDNIIEGRKPYREAHLALVSEHLERGEVILAGAFADPTDGAAIVFKVAAQTQVEEFVAKDPYVANKLVAAWRIREWNVVISNSQ